MFFWQNSQKYLKKQACQFFKPKLLPSRSKNTYLTNRQDAKDTKEEEKEDR